MKLTEVKLRDAVIIPSRPGPAMVLLPSVTKDFLSARDGVEMDLDGDELRITGGGAEVCTPRSNVVQYTKDRVEVAIAELKAVGVLPPGWIRMSPEERIAYEQQGKAPGPKAADTTTSSPRSGQAASSAAGISATGAPTTASTVAPASTSPIHPLPQGKRRR